MRNRMFDAIKGLAIISVVFSHTYRGCLEPNAIFIRELAMWSVPAFFILQGYFLYSPKKKPWLKGTIKKIKKAYLPFIAWAVFYGYFYLLVQGKHFTFEDVLLGKTAIHLYFMFHYMIFAIIFPLLYFMPAIYRKIMLWLMVFSNLALTIILEISKSEHLRIIPYSGPNPIKWWGFVAVGMLIAECPAAIEYCKRHKAQTIFVSLGLFIFGLAEPYAVGHVSYLFNKFALWPMSMGLIALLVIYYSKENALLKNQLAYIGERTFGIYLPHILVLFYLQMIIPEQRMLMVIINIAVCIVLTNGKNYIEKLLCQILPKSPS